VFRNLVSQVLCGLDLTEDPEAPTEPRQAFAHHAAE
jgi:hypothetical protein